MLQLAAMLSGWLDHLQKMAFLPMLFYGAAGFGLSLIVIALTIRFCQRKQFLARARDLHHTHKVAVPRLGGLGLAVALLVLVGLINLFNSEDAMSARQNGVFVVSTLAMFFVGFWDDLKPIGARRKMIAQVLIAATVYFLGFNIGVFKLPVSDREIQLGLWGLPITVLWLVGLTNLVNLIDGVDGLAGGICLMLMVLLAYVGGDTKLGFLAAGMTGALLGFLRFNFPPARIFMGDGGAYFLGFVIGMMTIMSSQKGTVAAALIAPLFVLALPIVDTSLAIFRRGIQGLPIFRPDRRHIHHRLMGMGMSSRKVVLGLYVFTLIFLTFGFLVYSSKGKMFPILFGLGLAILLGCAGWLSFSREWFSVGRVLGHSVEMRRDIQYALQMLRWLELEAARGASGESLFSDFVFILGKLGFCRVRLAMPGGEWVWQMPGSPSDCRQSRHEIHHGSSAVLELGACPQSGRPEEGAKSNGTAASGTASLPGIATEQLYETLSDLAAEAWQKAIRRWESINGCPLSFAEVGESKPYHVPFQLRPVRTAAKQQTQPQRS